MRKIFLIITLAAFLAIALSVATSGTASPASADSCVGAQWAVWFDNNPVQHKYWSNYNYQTPNRIGVKITAENNGGNDNGNTVYINTKGTVGRGTVVLFALTGYHGEQLFARATPSCQDGGDLEVHVVGNHAWVKWSGAWNAFKINPVIDTTY